ncbi:MAG: C40 family peptidase [Acidimicrobiales bacterium]
MMERVIMRLCNCRSSDCGASPAAQALQVRAPHRTVSLSLHRRLLGYPFMLLAATAMLLGVLPAGEASASPVASSSPGIASTQSEVTTLEQKILAQSEQIASLSEQFARASSMLATIDSRVAQINLAVALTKLRIATEQSRLRRDAIDQFVQDAPASQLSMLFAGKASQLGLRSQYMGVILGSTSADVSTLQATRRHLGGLQARLKIEQQSAVATVSRVRSSRSAAVAASASEQAILVKVKGQLAVEIAQRAAAQARAAAIQAQQAASAAQRRAAAQVAAESSFLAATLGSQPTGTTPPPPPPPPTVRGSTAGAIAVRAAESQLGVPYVWGGATPGVGFDCSGLTMWAWSQAGVQLAHFAATQYAETTHVPLSSLQPGDLLFYDFGGNGIDHVTMYVGSGPYGSSTVIQAAHTGTNVMFSPIWYTGLVGAGQP